MVGGIRHTYTIHLVLKSPITCHTKGVDDAGVLVKEGVQTYELVAVHLVMLSRSSTVPLTSYPLQHSVTTTVESEQSRYLGQSYIGERLILTGRHFVEDEQELGKTSFWPLDWISLSLPETVSDPGSFWLGPFLRLREIKKQIVFYNDSPTWLL